MSIEAMGWLRRSAGIDVAGTGTPMLTLNVGGTVFSTHTKTLIDYVDCCGAFRDAVAGSGRRGADGSLVIDRDPTTFRHVLNFLRNNKVLLLPDDFMEWDMLLADSHYYGLKELQSAILSNYDYQRRSFKRQLPSGVVFLWSEVTESTGGVSASPATPSTSGLLKVTVDVNPPLPALTYDAAAGVLHHQHAPITSLHGAASILTTVYGYKIQHWQTQSSEVVEELASSPPDASPQQGSGAFYSKKAQALPTSIARRLTTVTHTIFLSL